MSVTLLRARTSLTKIWQSDGTITPAANAAWFEAKEIPIVSLDGILAIIRTVEPWRRVALVKEAIAPGANRMRLRRRCEGGTDKRTGEVYPAGLHKVPRDWIALDVENLPRPASIDWSDGNALAIYVRSLLPDVFTRTACVWQFSGSSGHPSKRGEIRLHLFFMLNVPVLPAAWKHALAHLPFVDRSVFDKAKIIFTAAPVIQHGDDPITQRHGLLGGDPVVHVPADMLTRSVEIARGYDRPRRRTTPVVSAPMPTAAAAFVEIIALSNILRSRHPAYRGERGRRMAFCKMLRESFGIQDEDVLLAAFCTVCVGPDDPNADHDARQALDWARSVSSTGREFSTRKLLCDASAALHAAGHIDMGGRAARLAMVFCRTNPRRAAR